MSAAGAPLVVAAAADGAYALPLAVMLHSAAAHLAPEWRLVVYVVDDGIATRDREQVATALGARGTVTWLPALWPATTALPTWGGMPLTTYQKLTLAEWLPAGVERAIWLDCDVLVLADLGRLWLEPTGGAAALAVQDRIVPTLSSRFGVAARGELGLSDDAPYFNAGVMLVDLGRWRRNGVAARAFDYLARHRRRVTFWDQEALNYALAGRWSPLDRRWNVNPTLARLFDATGGRDDDEAWIVHFSGQLKPWRVGGLGPHQQRFFAHLDETAWRGERPRAGWSSRLVARYATSPLRRALFPLEQGWTALRRRASFHSEAPPERPPVSGSDPPV
ncbi:MAG TPA: glycosyltransferase family 8 protein [Thermoanaerobaculia bacterium]